MSLRLKLALFLCAVGLSGLLVSSSWSLRVGVGVLVAVLAGVALARLFSGNSEEAHELVQETRGRRKTFTDSTRAGALLEATMNGMREGMLVIDREMRIVASNPAARSLFGNVKTGLEHRRLSDLTRNPDIYAAFNAALNTNERAEVKVEMMGTDRQTFDLRVVPLHLGDEENTRGALGVFFDITRLERLERVRQEFLSNVSHELRTPLTAILAFVETLQDGAIDDQENNQRFLSIIQKNAGRMHNLINDILELSAIEAGTVSVRAEHVPLRMLVGDVLTALASRAQARGVALNNEIGSEVVVSADPHCLEQMLTNLVDNAIKFNRESGEVTITHERDSRDRITVADTGEGIPAEHIKRIFERFYRVDRARSREMGGTGLGLAIVKHLARAHGGEISVHSEPGKGSTFIIELQTGEQQITENESPGDSTAS